MSGTGIAGAMDYQPRQDKERQPHTCLVCGGSFKGGASYAVRVLPPIVEVCSATCAANPLFANPELGRAHVSDR